MNNLSRAIELSTRNEQGNLPRLAIGDRQARRQVLLLAAEFWSDLPSGQREVGKSGP
jgi:hypothetical protein